MAVGDQITQNEAVTHGNYCTIQPGAGVGWIIHNITWSGQVSVSTYDGSNECTFTTDTAAGGLLGVNLHLNNTDYMRVLNSHASNAIVVHYDGLVEI